MDRRLELLKKELYEGGLTPQERAELASLQKDFEILAKDPKRWYEWLKSKSGA